MFPTTTVHFAFSIAEIPSEYDSTTVIAPPRRETGMYVFIKPYNKEDPWFWGVLTSEINAERGEWTYQRIEQIELLEHIEKELMENEFIAIPNIDEFLPQNLLTGA